MRPVPHGPDIPIPTSLFSQTEMFSSLDAKDDYVYFSPAIESKNLQPFNQLELNDLVCVLGLTELLGTN